MQSTHPTTRKLMVVILPALMLPGAFAQETPCACKLGTIVVFDLANQVPAPAGDANAMLRWRNLFYGQLPFSTRIREGGIACASKLEDSAIWVAQQSGGGTLKSGPHNLNTAPPGPIKSIDYLLTGEITGSGNAYTITARIEAAYSREVVKTATVRTTGELVQMRAAVNSLADQLRPVSAAITAFEIQKRASNKDVARANPLVKIAIDVKPTMLDGERTQATLKMTDCDGFPLAGREIGFVEASWPEGGVEGTTGLELKSSTVVTDASGHATVSIRAPEPGAAQFEAWHRYRKPTGGPDVIVKTFPIKVEPYRFRPILTLTFEESLAGGDLKYTMRGKTTFALTFGPDGSQSFDKEALSSEDLYRLRGGLAGLKSGETLNLYALEEDASGTATMENFKPCTARHLLTRDGRFQSWVDGKPEENETWRTYVKDSQRVHGGEVLSATLTRTLDGAIFEYTPRTVRSSGCEYLSSVLWTHGFTAREKSAGLASFTLSEAQVADLGQLQQTRQGMLENTEERNLGPASITLKVTLSGAQ